MYVPIASITRYESHNSMWSVSNRQTVFPAQLVYIR